MKERPILFSGEMVRAILDGRKTMTRRIISPKIVNNWDAPRGSGDVDAGYPFISTSPNDEYVSVVKICPYGQPGDRLWVRETWRVGAWAENDGKIAVDYRADGHARKEWLYVEDTDYFAKLWQQSTDDAEKALGRQDSYKWEPGASPCRWRPSIFMPRWASRINLEIVSVRVEMVQDISEKDAKREGVGNSDPVRMLAYREHFQGLWDSINARRGYGWDVNPCVWVIEYKRIA